MANLPFDNGLAAGAGIYLRRMIIAGTAIAAVNTIGYTAVIRPPLPTHDTTLIIMIVNVALLIIAFQQRKLRKARREIRKRENELFYAITTLNQLSNTNPPTIMDFNRLQSDVAKQVLLTEEIRITGRASVQATIDVTESTTTPQKAEKQQD